MADFDQVSVVETPVLDDEDDDLGEGIEDVARVEQARDARAAGHEPQQGVAVRGAAAQRRQHQQQPVSEDLQLAEQRRPHSGAQVHRQTFEVVGDVGQHLRDLAARHVLLLPSATTEISKITSLRSLLDLISN